jgi:Holliday junction resolvasome RuvABC ATP-dependent DNA helicase subunit
MSKAIRPSTFDEIIGQDDVVKRLRVSAVGCKNGGGTMPHVLIDGPPGLGKTTIASAIANELGVNLYTANAASIRSIKNICHTLWVWRQDQYFLLMKFIDCQRLWKSFCIL